MQKKMQEETSVKLECKNSNLRNSTNTTRLLNAIQAILHTSFVPSPGGWGLGTRLTAHSAPEPRSGRSLVAGHSLGKREAISAIKVKIGPLSSHAACNSTE